MYNHQFVAQDPAMGRTSMIFRAISDLVAAANFATLRVAVAYASRAGCRELTTELERRLADWSKITKEWLISIDFGRTEPEALDCLVRLPNSMVRVPDGQNLLDRRLRPVRCFHPKSYVFEARSRNGPFAAFIGSANLTISGLHTGTEHGTATLWLPPLQPDERQSLESFRDYLGWWHAAWASADPVNRAFLRDYEHVRVPELPFEDDVESIREYATSQNLEVLPAEGLAWAQSRCFWIQTFELYKNRGPARPGNQLDCRRGTRVFFGFSPAQVRRNTVLGDILLQFEDRQATPRSVRYANNQMDKVNLPIPDDDGPPSYDHAYLHFERIGPQHFRLSLAKRNEEQRWRRKSQEQGMYYTFQGEREYGFYS